MNKSKNLDQFYTCSSTARYCSDLLTSTLPKLGYKTFRFIEPSVGTGAFLLSGLNFYKCYDIDPQVPRAIKQDFLLIPFPKKPAKNLVIIGNPPFGKRSKQAIAFLNKSSKHVDTIGFILPAHFKKWSAQKQIDEKLNLVLQEDLPHYSFVFNGKQYDVRCVFQIWTRRVTSLQNLRILQAPPIKHQDFILYQYNNTKQALGVFKQDWDFGVPRQGYADYTRREFNPAKCEKTTQWILFKARDKKVLRNLLNLDYRELAQRNTSTPGFGKADVVNYYNELYGEE